MTPPPAAAPAVTRLAARLFLERAGFRLDVTLDLPARGVAAIYGPSGGGKTTLLRCLAGLERAARGRVQLGEEVWQDSGSLRFVPAHRRGVGLVFQKLALFPHLSVRGNLEYGLRRTPLAERRLKLSDVCALLDLGSLLERHPRTLSGGEQQRVAIGRALLAGPRLLLLDEPLSSLDVARKREILPFLDRLKRELDVPMVVVSHIVGEIVHLADTVLLMRAGRIVDHGPIGEVFARLSHEGEARGGIGAVVDATAVGHDPDYGLTVVECAGRRLHVPHHDVPVGGTVRVHVLARDVSLSLAPARDSSALNELEATVREIGPADPARAAIEVLLDAGFPLRAAITRLSLARLRLAPGTRVFAHVKTVALADDLLG